MCHGLPPKQSLPTWTEHTAAASMCETACIVLPLSERAPNRLSMSSELTLEVAGEWQTGSCQCRATSMRPEGPSPALMQACTYYESR